MSGTSRALIQDLNAVFDNWENDLNNPQTSQLFKTIGAYHQKHNTLLSVQQSTNIHNELHRFYNNQIFPKSNLPREIFFVQILAELVPVLSEEEVGFWLKTYLKPAVDSGNYDLQFIQACKDFINKVGINFDVGGDQDLNSRRYAIASMVMNHILDIYLGSFEKTIEILDLNVEEDEIKSQEFFERLRFIRSNCLPLLYDYALKHPKSFAMSINTHFVDAKQRLRVLTLLTHVLNSRSSALHAIVETDLFINIFKCLLFDFNERVLYACLACLVMLVPLVSDRISQYVSDLLVIYTRVILWNTYAFSIPYRINLLKGKFNTEYWQISEPEETSPDEISNGVNSRPPFDSHIILDAGHLVSVIYGLFPYSLTLYSQDPLAYLEKYPTQLLPRQHLNLINNAIGQELSPKDKGIMEVVPGMTRTYLKSFILHPNFLHPERLSVEYERKDPTKWLIDDKQDDSLGVEEILIGCLGLNPALGFYIPNVVDSDSMKTKSTGSLGEGDAATDGNIRSYHPSVVSTGKSSNGGSQSVSRTSSVAGPIFFNFGGLTGPNNHTTAMNRKLSVVPTNLVIDSHKSSEISFNEVNYASSRTGSTYDDNINAHNGERKGSDPLKELFSTHESLYNTKPRNDSTFSDQTHIGELKTDVHSLLGDKVNLLRTQPSMASVDSSKETVFSTSSGPTVQEPKKVFSGTALDFYQRELLLMKNEVEFASYMKHLNKFQYIKLKLEVSKHKRDGSLWEKSAELLNDQVKYDKLKESHENLKQAFAELQKEFETGVSSVKIERDDFATKLLKLQDTRRSITDSLAVLESENAELKSHIETLTKEVVPQKDQSINHLSCQLKDIQTDYDLIEKELADVKVSKPVENIDTKETAEVDGPEKQIFDMKQELNMLNERNFKLNEEIQYLKVNLDTATKRYETKVGANKNEVAFQLGNIHNQYEKKIQELSSTILKYETLLEEKNLRIAQLSSSRPISIPGSMSTGSEMGRNPSQSQSHFNAGYTNNGSNNATGQTHPMAIQNPQGQYSQPMYENNPMDLYEANRQSSNSSNESISAHAQLPFNTPPLHTPVPMSKHSSFTGTQPQSTPIVKGRGGYQKRSKKHM